MQVSLKKRNEYVKILPCKLISKGIIEVAVLTTTFNIFGFQKAILRVYLAKVTENVQVSHVLHKKSNTGHL